MRRPGAVLFDFDYTLGDSSAGIVECVRDALRRMGHDALPSEETICATIGLTLGAMYTRFTGREVQAEQERFHQLFVDRADQVMVDATVLYDATPEVLHALRRRGLRLGVVTTKYGYRVLQILKRDGLEGLLDVIVGSDLVDRPKPDPQGLLMALDGLGVAPGDALMVGDSTTDAAAAQAAEVGFVGVLSGTTPRETLATYPHRAVLQEVGELPGWLGLEPGPGQGRAAP